MGPRGLRSLWYHVQVNSAPYVPTTESRGRARLSRCDFGLSIGTI